MTTVNQEMNSGQALKDLQYIQETMKRTTSLVDSHSFWSVLWGGIALVQYPVANWLAWEKNFTVLGFWILGTVLFGVIAGTLMEMRLSKKPRLAAENKKVGKQVLWIVVGIWIGSSALAGIGGTMGFIQSQYWGVYFSIWTAGLCYAIGVVYSWEYIVAGVIIFVAALLGLLFMNYYGFIIGPLEGVALIWAGIVGERRVKRLIREQHHAE